MNVISLTSSEINENSLRGGGSSGWNMPPNGASSEAAGGVASPFVIEAEDVAFAAGVEGSADSAGRFVFAGVATGAGSSGAGSPSDSATAPQFAVGR